MKKTSGKPSFNGKRIAKLEEIVGGRRG